MLPKHDLFLLIKSLSSTEKRYFKIYSTRHVIGKENNYIALFDSIDGMKNYDEAKLKSRLLVGKSAINLSVEKVHLKSLILKSLTAFYSKKSLDIILYERLIQLEIMYDKGLFDIGLDIVDKSIAEAIKYEKSTQLLALFVWKVNFETKLNRSKELLESITNLNNTAFAFQGSLKFMHALFELLTIMTHSGSKEGEAASKKAFQNIKKMETEKPPSTVLGKYYYYSMKGLISDKENNLKSATDNFAKIVSLFNANPFFVKERPNIYLIVINNYVVSLIGLGQYDLALEALEGLQEFKERNKLTNQLGARAFLILAENRLVVYSKTERYAEALAFSKDIEQSFEKYSDFVDFNRKLDLYYSLFSVAFQTKQYKKANVFLNKILNQKSTADVKIDLISLCMISQLILMIDSEDLLLFESKFNRAKRFIENKTTLKLFSPVLSILQIFYTNKQTINKAIKLKNYLIEFKRTYNKSDAHTSISFFFDIEKWLETKIKIKQL